ncbi:MAG: amino acid permease [Planctomycetes bacterium]|nr:amino acid permease [Planctomycetota bacterium]
MAEGGGGTLRRELGVLDGAGIVISSMVGAGIFASAGFSAESLTSPGQLFLLWIIGGLYALAGAWCYAELGAMIPRAGGEYAYLREAYGPFVAYLSGWTSFVCGFSGFIAVMAMTAAEYFRAIFPGYDPGAVLVSIGPVAVTQGRLVAIGIILVATAFHSRDLRLGMGFQNILTGLKVLAIVVFVAAAFAFGRLEWGNFKGLGDLRFPTWQAFGAALVGVLYSYSGWNAAAYLAGEMRDPGRTLIRALLLGTAVTVVLYLAMNVVYVGALSLQGMPKPDIARAAGDAMWSPTAGSVAGVAFGLLILSSVGAAVMTGPRIYYAMAQDRVFPKAIAGVLNRHGIPQRGIIVQALVSILLLLTGTFQQLFYWVTVGVTVFYLLAIVSVPILRWKDPSRARPVRVRAIPIILVFFVAITVYFAASNFIQYWKTSLYGFCFIAAGTPFYLIERLRARSGSA